MASVVGIICEYNPFHKGHLYQIEQIKKEITDATIIAIMSGNVVQRGEFAIIDKYERAKIAIECGVDAVFEMPYPYSGSTAEIFAEAGVRLAHGLCCDYLYFGSETGDIKFLEEVATAVDSAEFEAHLKLELMDKDNSYILAKKNALDKMGVCLPQSSNDMLAVEYIRAIKNNNFDIKYRTVKRVGAGYNDTRHCEIMSATAIRQDYYENGVFSSVPDCVAEQYASVARNARCLDMEFSRKLLHTHVLMNAQDIDGAFDSSKEIRALVADAASHAKDSCEFFEILSSKAYTSSRIKRVIMYSLFGVKSLCRDVDFTILLGMNKSGQEHLNKIKKQKRINVITKHADSRALSPESKRVLELTYRVDGLYKLLLSSQRAPIAAYENKPFIKN